MAFGLGNHYLVQVIKWKSGTLEECIEFMNQNKPINTKEWYELEPIPDVKNGTCSEYHCSLVKMVKKEELL